jgi:hypothetical protein
VTNVPVPQKSRYSKLSAQEVDRVSIFYNHGVTLKDIAASIDRPIGTILTLTTRLRAAGVIGRRYELPDFGTLDA